MTTLYQITDLELERPAAEWAINVKELPRVFWESRSLREFFELRDYAFHRDAQIFQYEQEYSPEDYAQEEEVSQ